MKVILDLKKGNKSDNNITKVIEFTPEEYYYLKDIVRHINNLAGQDVINAYVKEI